MLKQAEPDGSATERSQREMDSERLQWWKTTRFTSLVLSPDQYVGVHLGWDTMLTHQPDTPYEGGYYEVVSRVSMAYARGHTEGPGYRCP